ncbi:MAG: capsular biosynthesis protein [Pseudomonadota bacterium]
MKRIRPDAGPRTILMLQGPASALWREVRDALTAQGHRVLHVALALGDVVYWRRRGMIAYRGTLDDWPAWLESLILREGIDDLLYFADCLPYHRTAAELAARRGLRAWAVENGYLRPDWLTLEPFGMGRHSRFARCPDRIVALAEGQPPASLDSAWPLPFWVDAMNEMAFNIAHSAGRSFFPHYDDDRVISPWREYAGWVPHLIRLRRIRSQARQVERRCLSGADPYAVIALQMETDYQIRVSSDFASQAEMLEIALLTMARRAPPQMRAVVKVHPCDNGLIDWWAVVEGLCQRFGLEGRVDVIRGGRLDALLRQAIGLITINSTTAVHALRLGRPVIALGEAVFDVPGLTHQGGLETFWAAPEHPDPVLFDRWCRAMAAEIQVRGSQKQRHGRRIAAREIARRITHGDRYWRLHDSQNPLSVEPAALPAPRVAATPS